MIETYGGTGWFVGWLIEESEMKMMVVLVLVKHMLENKRTFTHAYRVVEIVNGNSGRLTDVIDAPF